MSNFRVTSPLQIYLLEKGDNLHAPFCYYTRESVNIILKLNFTGMKSVYIWSIAILLGSINMVALANEEPEKPKKKFTIENCVSKFSMNGIDSTKVGYQFWFVDKNFLDGRTLKMSVVKPHEATHAPHIHKEDEFFFVLEGTAEFHLDGKTTVAGPYASFYCPANVAHGIKNVGDTELKYLVIKKYQK